jgi:hypothetical protein
MFDLIFQQVEGCGTMTIADRARVYRSLAKSREASALRAYLRFVDEQREALLAGSTTGQQRTLVDCGFKPRETRSRRGGTESTLTLPEFGKFPGWKFVNYNNSLWNPSKRNLRSLLINYYNMVEPELHAHIICRDPGRGASSDATFRLMIRTKGNHGKVPLLVPADMHAPAPAGNTVLIANDFGAGSRVRHWRASRHHCVLQLRLRVRRAAQACFYGAESQT